MKILLRNTFLLFSAIISLFSKFGQLTVSHAWGYFWHDFITLTSSQLSNLQGTAEKMVEFTEDQIEDIKDGFELYDRTGEGKLYYNQVGDLIRGLGFKPTNANVMEALGGPKKEEMNTKTCNFDEFINHIKFCAEKQQDGTFEDFVEGLRVFDKEGNGTVMGAEVRHILATLGEKLTVDEVEIIFEGAEDADGQIHYENFIKELMKEKE
ncbi:unnamed protein product [Oikopleura dioica]|uniref:EF-hand domain-containing protein n=1 Tax=Oikopleura dioica TaxID=34765 RepID=E4YA54_OIKDI|nr:unnamed protein product [Oikopleura dioica]